MGRAAGLLTAVMLLVLVLPAGPAGAENAVIDRPEASAKQRAETLVRQLGHRSFETREEAARELEVLGAAARGALLTAVQDADLEIRYRAQRLLETVDRLEHERRLTEFLQDPSSVSDDFLPGWQRFRLLAGADDEACELFAAMHQAEGKLFRLSERDDKEFEEEFEKRCLETLYGHAYGQSGQASLGTVAALVYFASETGYDFSNRTGGSIYSLVYQNEFRKALTGEKYAQPVRKLLAEWIRRPDSDIAYQKITLAMQHDIREGIVPALEIIRGASQAPQLQYAICAVGKLGGTEHIPELENLFDNQAVLSVSQANEKTTYRCEVRDVALAAVLCLTKQDPAEYGFNRLRKNPQSLFSLNSAGFDNPDDREAAFEKWNQWKAANLGVAGRE